MLQNLKDRIGTVLEAFPAPVKTFALRALVLFLFWKGLYLFVWQEPRTLDAPLTKAVGRQSTVLLNMIRPADTFRVKEGIHSTTMEGVTIQKPQTLIYKGSRKLVGIEDGCNGLELFVLYIGFILAMPASFARKIAFGAGGLLVIHAVNLLRCSGLGLMLISMKQYFDLAHHYIFKIVIYATIFLLWVAYSRKLKLTGSASETV